MIFGFVVAEAPSGQHCLHNLVGFLWHDQMQISASVYSGLSSEVVAATFRLRKVFQEQGQHIRRLKPAATSMMVFRRFCPKGPVNPEISGYASWLQGRVFVKIPGSSLTLSNCLPEAPAAAAATTSWWTTASSSVSTSSTSSTSSTTFRARSSFADVECLSL
jgi:hypothetical protein